MVTTYFRLLIIIIIGLGVMSCGYRPAGRIPLAPPLYTLCLETKDPYGQLTRYLKQFLNVSNVKLVDKPEDATAVLVILSESQSQQLLGISGTQQTRQYNLVIVVTFQVTDPKGNIIVPPQRLSQSRTFTIKSDQILAGTNEASNLFNQIRQAITYDIMTRLGSTYVTELINTAMPNKS